MWFILNYLLWLNISVLGADQLQINKCCPQGEKIDEYLDCTPIEETDYDEEKSSSANDPKGLLSWFPLESVVNATTLKIHEHHRDFYLKILNEKFTVNYGQMPKCDSNYTKQVSFFKTDVIEFYNFILYDNLTFKIYISKPGSLHDPLDVIHFATIQEDHAWKKDNLTRYQIDSLRTFPMENACVDVGFMGIHFLVYCPCRTSICIRKCCAEDEFYNATTEKCEKFEGAPLTVNNWRPEVNGVIDQYYLLTDTFPSCESFLVLKKPDHAYKSCPKYNKESDNDFTFFNNGSVKWDIIARQKNDAENCDFDIPVVEVCKLKSCCDGPGLPHTQKYYPEKIRKYKKPHESHQYCGEVTWHENGDIYEQNLLLCNPLKLKEDSKKRIIYSILLIIGCICLLITVSVSLYLPELRRRMHNKIALSHNISLMVAYFTWAFSHLMPHLGKKSCLLLALISQFAFLASFFWLNVMCLDLSMTFSAIRSLGGSSSLGEHKKFFYYCIYTWGSTTVISVITMIMEFLPDVPYDFLKPALACSCGFNAANASILVYFYGPIFILLIINLILFIFTTIKIMSVQRQTAILQKTDSNRTGGSPNQSDKQRYDLFQWLILYAKLFLLMGITWITEVISWALGGPAHYWYFSDVLNLLRGVFIFILFICKRPVLESLKRKLKRNLLKGGSARSMSDVMSTSTSLRDTRLRSSVNSKRKESVKAESEAQKLISEKPPGEIRPRNGGLEESCL